MELTHSPCAQDRRGPPGGRFSTSCAAPAATAGFQCSLQLMICWRAATTRPQRTQPFRIHTVLTPHTRSVCVHSETSTCCESIRFAGTGSIAYADVHG